MHDHPEVTGGNRAHVQSTHVLGLTFDQAVETAREAPGKDGDAEPALHEQTEGLEVFDEQARGAVREGSRCMTLLGDVREGAGQPEPGDGAAPGKRRGCVEAEAFGPELTAYELTALGARHAQGEVGFAGGEADDLIVGEDAQAQLRVGLTEVSQGLCQYPANDFADGRYRHLTPELGAGIEGRPGHESRLDHRLDGGEQRHAPLGQPDGGLAQQERRPGARFELAQVPAHGRLAHAEGPRSRGEAAEASHRLEGAQPIPMHRLVHPYSDVYRALLLIVIRIRRRQGRAMRFHHLRNATSVLTLGEHRLLVDPMLSDLGAMPGFKMFGGGRRRNPLVALPDSSDAALAEVTGVLITHEHPDHFDPVALAWIRDRGLPVWATAVDAPNLVKKGLQVRELSDGCLGMAVEVIPSRHGRGLLGWMMGPVNGYYLAHPDEPSVYMTGDATLTDSVVEAITRLRPDVVIAPAGAANMGIGGDILFSVDDLVTIAKLAPGQLIFNHLEALDHCPTTRASLRERMDQEGLGDRVLIPSDGESLAFEGAPDFVHVQPRAAATVEPGMQKWVTAKFAGT